VLSDDDVQINVSCISYAFDNVSLLKLLSQRGNLVTNAKYDKLQTVDESILRLKEHDHVKISRPVAAFITFQT
jgi:hypothetical protein